MIYSVHIDTFDTIVVCVRVKNKNTRAVERAPHACCWAYAREHKVRSIGMCARARVFVCVCAWTSAPGIAAADAAPPLERDRHEGERRKNARAREPDGSQMRYGNSGFVFVMDLTSAAIAHTHGKPDDRQRLYILLLQRVNCGSGDVWPSARDRNRK